MFLRLQLVGALRSSVNSAQALVHTSLADKLRLTMDFPIHGCPQNFWRFPKLTQATVHSRTPFRFHIGFGDRLSSCSGHPRLFCYIHWHLSQRFTRTWSTYCLKPAPQPPALKATRSTPILDTMP